MPAFPTWSGGPEAVSSVGSAAPLAPRIPCRSTAVDIIFLNDLRIETTIGIYEWERRIRQTVTLDLEMATDAARAAATDRIEDALD